MVQPIPITWSLIVQFGLMLMGVWTFYKIIREIISAITARHDKEQKWDEYEKNLKDERDKIYVKYDARLEEIDKRIESNENIAKQDREVIKSQYNEKLQEIENKIDYSHCESEAKIQELKSEVLILTKGMAAVLDGLIQQNCNGPVTEAKRDLDSFLISKL